jgi:hypothetical protein
LGRSGSAIVRRRSPVTAFHTRTLPSPPSAANVGPSPPNTSPRMGWTGVLKVCSRTKRTTASLAGPPGADGASGFCVSWAAKARKDALSITNERIVIRTEPHILSPHLPGGRLRQYPCSDAVQHSTTGKRKAVGSRNKSVSAARTYRTGPHHARLWYPRRATDPLS